MKHPVRTSLLIVAALTVVPVSAMLRGSSPSQSQDTYDLLLRAANPNPGKLSAGKVRVPIDVDGVPYEIIVAEPGAPRLSPAK